jgi:glutamate-1-semialdehyde 2,1-aminomutase
MAANPLSIAAIRATLEHVLTEDAFATMAELAARATAGIDAIARRAGLPWSTSRLGGLAAWQFSPRPPRNAGESLAAMDDELSGWHRLHEINRGVLLMPFLGNVLRMSPATTTQDVDRFLAALSEAVETLLA